MILTFVIAGLTMALLAGALLSQRPRFGRRLRRGFPSILAAAVAGVGSVFLLSTRAPASNGSSTPELALQVFGGALIISICALGVFLVGVNLAGFDPDASVIADRLAVDETSQKLMSRWVHRVRWRRWIGGVAGVVAAVLSGNAGALIFVGIAGAAAGSVSAEIHLCRPQRPTTRVANLEQRQLRDYVDRSSSCALVAVAMVAVALIVWAASVDAARSTIWWALGALVSVGFAATMMVMVVTRRRPALSVELNAADDLRRRLAVTNGIAHPMIAVGLVLLCASFTASDNGGLAFVVGLASVMVWWKNRRGGLDYLLKQPAKPAHLMTR